MTTLRSRLLLSFIPLLLMLGAGGVCHAIQPFGLEVIDEQTGRGVPLVELRTTNQTVFYTDSAGLAAIDAPELVGLKVFFEVRGFGYEFPADGFGMRGRAVDVQPGEVTTLKVKRTNIAERLYRVTGAGIYRDSLMLGREAPIQHPLLNAEVVGQDSVLALPYRDKLYYFWGDTSRLRYPLGLFAMAGATAALPGKAGTDPGRGVDLQYFAGDDGFARGMAPLPDPGPVWLDGIFTAPDDDGRERMIAHYSRMKSLSEKLERGLMVFDDQSQTFQKREQLPLDAPLSPAGQPVRVQGAAATGAQATDHTYFATPYPSVRVKRRLTDALNVSSYEAFTPLVAGTTRLTNEQQPPLERDGQGKLVWAWKRETLPLSAKQINALVEAKTIVAEECPFYLRDVSSDRPLLAHGGSVRWNEHLQRWLMIFVELEGDSMLGEVYCAAAPQPEGPWRRATKIATHHMPAELAPSKRAMNMDFYNPVQHAFFDQDGGRTVYFEGTYTNSFSGYPMPTPRYEYNQLMYRLDVSDPRIKW